MKSADVIVIGGGVSGLAAATTLALRGARVLVLEAKAVLGGRASAFTDPQTAERVDNGQHVLLGCYDATFGFLRQLGTDDRVRLQATLDVDFVDRAGSRSRLRLPPLPPPLNLAGGLLDWEALGWRDRAAVLSMSRPIRIAQQEQSAAGRGRRPDRIAASPDETVEQWLINNGQTARLRQMLWEPLALAALNQSIQEAAAPPFAAVLARMFGGESRAASLGLPACPLDELIAEPARRLIEDRGGEVRIGAPARVALERDGVACVETRGERIHAGVVVCAVPWYALPDLFAGDTDAVRDVMNAAARTAPSAIASVNVWLDRRVLRSPFLGLPGRTFQWVFDKGQLFEGRASHLTFVSSGADALMALPNAELIDTALRELRDALPDARGARVERATAFRERRATFSLAPDQPKRPASRTAIDRLYLAGDWVDTGLPSTIEGAVISGQRAARLIS